jgi:hypothetical protein
LPAVRRHSVALMTGSLPLALYEILTWAAPDAPHKEYLWNHPPGWLIWLSVMLAMTTAQYRAWLDMRKQRDMSNRKLRLLEADDCDRQWEARKKTSDATVAEYWSGDTLSLRVKNHSDAEWFSAVIERLQGSMSDWPDRMVFAKWDHQDAVKAQIPRDGHRLLLVGRLVRDYRRPMPLATWEVPYTGDSGPGLARSAKSFRPEPEYGHLVPRTAVELRITIYADNGVTGGSYVADVRLCGEEHAIVIRRLPPPADPPLSKASE